MIKSHNDNQMTSDTYTVYFVSESTGITAKALGSSLLSQFPIANFQCHHVPFINTEERARKFICEIEQVHTSTGKPPIIFATMPNPEIDTLFRQAPCYYYELFSSFVDKLTKDIGLTAVNKSGLQHGLVDRRIYDRRMDIVNYTLVHDDAMNLNNLEQADVILVGVSRSGKTPTCLYLAMQFGILTANYPITEEDFARQDFPSPIKKNMNKLVALTIMPSRLYEIRSKRSPGSKYATLAKCQSEIRLALKLFNHYNLEVLDTTSSSIEELAAKIMRVRDLESNHSFKLRDNR